MPNLFEGLFKGFLGQSEIPDLKRYSAESVFQNLRSNQDALANANVDYYRKTGIPGAQVTRDIENIYDPNAGTLREATTSRILGDLNLGGKLPRDVQDAVLKSSLEKGASAGLGFSPASRSLTARDLGLTSLDLNNSRLSRAQSYTGQLSNQFRGFLNDTMGNTDNFFSPTQFANLDVAGTKDSNAIDTYTSELQSQNNKAMAAAIQKAIGRIIGGVMSGGATEAMGGIGGGAGGGFGGGSFGGSGGFN
jgi:hypothetical protein